MKKLVVKLNPHDDKSKRKAMKTVSSLSGIDSISMDMKEQKMTVIGDVDPIAVVTKLRKGNWHTEILSVGPAKEDKKDQQQQGGGGGGGGKKDDKKKDNINPYTEQNIAELQKLYKSFNPYMNQQYYYYHYIPSVQENPNGCGIL